jgi:hypothetical protein
MFPPYFDPLGEFEPDSTKYRIFVCRPRQSHPWNQLFSYLGHSDESKKNTPVEKGYDESDLTYMEGNIITMESKYFPYSMRCSHVQRGSLACTKRCYVLEKGGGMRKCKRSDCRGHVYNGRVKESNGIECFGKSESQRLVCIDRN